MRLAGTILYWWIDHIDEIEKIVDMPWLNKYFFMHLKIAFCVWILSAIAKFNGYGYPDNPLFVRDAMHMRE